ncbi:MAG: hypothetical protein COA90_10300 [Gammaproteobacteria bacterium]|nr:MAG: hypothetical protein COA90_10300 [Gammaproteobacteria bacterium]
MTTWFSIELNDDEAAKTAQKVMDAFMPKYIGSGRPLGMAIFSSHNVESNITTLYFAPKAASLAMQFGANACDSNFVDMDLALLVGDESSIAYLFPEAEDR